MLDLCFCLAGKSSLTVVIDIDSALSPTVVINLDTGLSPTVVIDLNTGLSPTVVIDIDSAASPTMDKNFDSAVHSTADEGFESAVSPTAYEDIDCTESPAAENNIDCTVNPTADEGIHSEVSPAAGGDIDCTDSTVAENNTDCTVSPTADEDIDSAVGPTEDDLTDSVPTEVPYKDDIVWRYKLCDKLGKGGFGSVYEGIRYKDGLESGGCEICPKDATNGISQCLLHGHFPTAYDMYLIHNDWSKFVFSQECCHLMWACLQRHPEHRLLLEHTHCHDCFLLV